MSTGTLMTDTQFEWGSTETGAVIDFLRGLQLGSLEELGSV